MVVFKNLVGCESDVQDVVGSSTQNLIGSGSVFQDMVGCGSDYQDMVGCRSGFQIWSKLDPDVKIC